MKNRLVLVALLAVGFALPNTGCKKYDEGPSMSLRSAKSRLAGTWKEVASYTNGVQDQCDADCIKYRDNSSTEFKKDGTMIITSSDGTTSLSLSGTWVFNSDKTEVISTVTYSFGGYTSTSIDTTTIVRLTNKELWTKNVSGSNVSETHSEAK